MKQRKQVLADFKTKKARVLLLSKSLGGVGLNIKRKRMIIMDPAQNEVNDNQVAGRIKRRGHPGPLTVAHYQMQGKTMDVHLNTKHKR